MPRTHRDVIEATENRLIDALKTSDNVTIFSCLHDDVIYTNENGEVFRGIKNLQINDKAVLKFENIEVFERSIDVFSSVSVVNTLERRNGYYRGFYFDATYRLTRIWKFHCNTWKLIATSTVLV